MSQQVNPPIAKAAHFQASSCSQCSLSSLCLPLGLDSNELDQLESLVEAPKTYQESSVLVRQNSPFSSIFAVRSGMFKSVSVDGQGVEQVLDFHLPGELVGLDAIYAERYPSSVIAVDTASVCTISYNALSHLSASIPSLQKQLVRLLSKKLHNSREQHVDIPADQRLASFLFGLSKRFEARGYSNTQFSLSMPRRDIANYLHMAPETISRLFKKMRDDGVISLDRRALSIENMDVLRGLAGCSSAL